MVLAEVVEVILPWTLSILTIGTMILAGNRNQNTWLLGLFNQALWLLWIYLTDNWGFLPMNLALWITYLRNHFKWMKED